MVERISNLNYKQRILDFLLKHHNNNYYSISSKCESAC